METDNKVYRVLFDQYGNEVGVTADQLAALDQLTTQSSLSLPHTVHYSPGRYWFVSRTAQQEAALVEMLVFKSPPATHPKTHVAFATEGIAGYPHFNIGTAIQVLNGKNNGLGEVYNTHLPLLVADKAQEMVGFSEGRLPRQTERNLVSLVRGPGDNHMQKGLAQVCTDEQMMSLMRLLAGREATVTSLIVLIGLYCYEQGIVGEQLQELLRILLREHHLSYACSLLNIG